MSITYCHQISKILNPSMHKKRLTNYSTYHFCSNTISRAKAYKRHSIIYEKIIHFNTIAENLDDNLPRLLRTLQPEQLMGSSVLQMHTCLRDQPSTPSGTLAPWLAQWGNRGYIPIPEHTNNPFTCELDSSRSKWKVVAFLIRFCPWYQKAGLYETL